MKKHFNKIKHKLPKEHNKRMILFCVIGCFLCCIIYGLTREYPLQSYDYINKSDEVDYYVHSKNRSGTKDHYAMRVLINNTYYSFYRKIDDDFAVPDDLTNKDYFFNTKVLVLNDYCKTMENNYRNCRSSSFYDGYFYSYKYDKIFRIESNTGYFVFFDRYGGYLFIMFVFYGLYGVFNNKSIFAKKNSS